MTWAAAAASATGALTLRSTGSFWTGGPAAWKQTEILLDLYNAHVIIFYWHRDHIWLNNIGLPLSLIKNTNEKANAVYPALLLLPRF